MEQHICMWIVTCNTLKNVFRVDGAKMYGMGLHRKNDFSVLERHSLMKKVFLLRKPLRKHVYM